MPIENKQHKDTVFRMLYSDKRYLLELYNAINHSNYNDPSKLKITTLEGETFLHMKNDVSFLLDFKLNLYDHQSSPCPNIPLRDLQYVASIYKNLILQEKTYKAERIRIPEPKFIVFYNGTVPMQDEVTYKLSDMFDTNGDEPQLELIVHQYNVNAGHNPELMQACSTLKQYSLFVQKVRKYREEYMNSIGDEVQNDANFDESLFKKEVIRKAVEKAIDECIKEDILRDFFVKYRKEVIKVGVLEYSAERHLQVIKDEGYALGCRDTENELRPQIDSLTKEKEAAVSEKEAAVKEKEDAVKEIEYLRQLLKENNIEV
ncbi:hypothetical protein [Butyrivibrio sp. AE3006]|uniref:hypothetical protein n=1 Tax=Butyrivibrio sp. AE3006 TaxID=1280673 RepID=UPI0004066E34|nr:hypothetical protein [Butyrivibrio sp. AE3006]